MFHLNGRVGWLGHGLELTWMPSGQTSIASFVEANDDHGNAVSFIVELRPGWFYGDRRATPSWQIEVTVDVDCQHADDHGSMHQVFQRTTTAADPGSAVAALDEAVQLLITLANGRPLDDWTALGAQ